MTIKRQLLQVGLSSGALTVFMMATKPNDLAVILLVVPFILLFWASYSLWNLVRVLRHRFFMEANSTAPSGRSRLGFAICLGADLLLVLQSSGQLTTRDVVTLGAIILIGYAYFTRSRFASLKQP